MTCPVPKTQSPTVQRHNEPTVKRHCRGQCFIDGQTWIFAYTVLQANGEHITWLIITNDMMTDRNWPLHVSTFKCWGRDISGDQTIKHLPRMHTRTHDDARMSRQRFGKTADWIFIVGLLSDLPIPERRLVGAELNSRGCSAFFFEVFDGWGRNIQCDHRGW